MFLSGSALEERTNYIMTKISSEKKTSNTSGPLKYVTYIDI